VVREFFKYKEDRHRARVLFGAILVAMVTGLSGAIVYLAVTGPAMRWVVAATGFAVGAVVIIVLARSGRQTADSRDSRRSPPWYLGVGIFAAALVVPFLDSASGTVQIAALAVADGVFVAMAVLARRGVLRERAMADHPTLG
jgi:undecaprenyl pyrophosphate phosphatase UppP